MILTWSPAMVQRLTEIASERGITIDALLFEIVAAYLATQETQTEVDQHYLAGRDGPDPLRRAACGCDYPSPRNVKGSCYEVSGLRRDTRIEYERHIYVG